MKINPLPKTIPLDLTRLKAKQKETDSRPYGKLVTKPAPAPAKPAPKIPL